MLFRSTVAALYAALSRRLFSSSSSSSLSSSSGPKLPRFRNLSQIPYKYKPKALEAAQNALTDYLHGTRYIPFAYAEQISKNSPYFLSRIISKVKFSPSTFSRSLQKFLRYHPVNEFEFFYESIGIDFKEIDGYLPANKFFLSDDSLAFDAACFLASFGFPWNKLGKLYQDEISIFSRDPCELNKMLRGLKDVGFTTSAIIGICLAFPCVLSRKGDLNEIDALINDLKTVLIDSDLINHVEDDVDACCKLCEKIRVFYDLGCRKGTVGTLMGKSKHIFLNYSTEDLIEKVDFFCRLGVEKEEVGLLLLSRTEIFCIDLRCSVISILGFLEHFGLNSKHLRLIAQDYPYAMGRNRLANLPHVMRLLDLNKWFCNMIKSGNHPLLSSYNISSSEEDIDKDYIEKLYKIEASRSHAHAFRKLDFLHSIGYGENKLTIKVFNSLHGTRSELEERFDCLLQNGVEYSKLCKMISSSPKILNQKSETLKEKLKFLFEEIGSSVKDLDAFPAYLCYDLENRIKPRYKFHMWLLENKLCPMQYSLASMIATSEKSFIARVSSFHPDAEKIWYERFSGKSHNDSC